MTKEIRPTASVSLTVPLPRSGLAPWIHSFLWETQRRTKSHLQQSQYVCKPDIKARLQTFRNNHRNCSMTPRMQTPTLQQLPEGRSVHCRGVYSIKQKYYRAGSWVTICQKSWRERESVNQSKSRCLWSTLSWRAIFSLKLGSVSTLMRGRQSYKDTLKLFFFFLMVLKNEFLFSISALRVFKCSATENSIAYLFLTSCIQYKTNPLTCLKQLFYNAVLIKRKDSFKTN